MKGTVEFYHLRSFVAVAEEENLTKAASRLYTTPPAISAHIKALEEELDTVLFIRSSKGMKLTPQGEQLLEKAQNTLNSALDLVKSATQNSKNLTGEIRISINQPVSVLPITAICEQFRLLHTQVGLVINESTSQQIIGDLRQHKIDIGFFYGELPPELFGYSVKRQKITTIIPNSFSEKIDNQAFSISQIPWIQAAENCPFERFNPHVNDSVAGKIRVASDLSRVEFVKSGLGASYIELEVAEKLVKGSVVVRNETLDFELTLWVACLESRKKEANIATLLDRLTELSLFE